MKSLRNFLFMAAIVIIFILLTSVYTVPQTQKALLLELGKLKQDRSGNPLVIGPGLHFKIPFISHVSYFDTRLRTLEIKEARIVTIEKKDVLVNSFVKWRIKDFANFYRATSGNFDWAGNLLAQKAEDALRAEFGKRTIREVVSGERLDIMELLRKSIAANAEEMGIEVTDVRIKRIDLPTEVSDSVYSRMRAEREQAAAEHRAEGEREAEKIKANADKRATILLAEAYKKAKILRGEGDSEAARIYAEAYSKDPDFYAFYKSLDAYKNVFKDKSELLLLSPQGDFFKYFKQFENEQLKQKN